MDRLRVLWVEDRAFDAYGTLASPVYLSGRYSLSIALNATQGESRISNETFDAVVVDVRLPPGEDSRWLQIFREHGKNKVSAKLGLRLLQKFLLEKEFPPETWIRPSRFGVLSVETRSEIESDLDKLGVPFYREKTIDGALALVELLDAITRQR